MSRSKIPFASSAGASARGCRCRRPSLESSSGCFAGSSTDGAKSRARFGRIAHYLMEPPAYGGPILWWDQDGTYVAISGPGIARDELLKIAVSMSKTADLGETGAVAARPTPTPIPTPGFPILRPMWLPEPMTIGQQVRPSGTGGMSEVVLTFDPRPNDAPHDLLTLRERAQVPEEAPAPNAQSTRETIDGHVVTIVHRGQG